MMEGPKTQYELQSAIRTCAQIGHFDSTRCVGGASLTSAKSLILGVDDQ